MSASGGLEHAEGRFDREKALEHAITGALPTGSAYFFVPVLLWHANGSCYGVLGNANAALAWQRGADPRERELFYLTDIDGNRVTIKDNPSSPGHASAIRDALRAQDEA